MHVNKLLFVSLWLICFFKLQGFQPNTQKGRGKIIFPPLHYPIGGVLNMYTYVWAQGLHKVVNEVPMIHQKQLQGYLW